ncbi:MAG: DUF2147 domain-containing protein [Prevotella sp.]|nr:DUF2147 domain-containing protein [Prevotella sp.]
MSKKILTTLCALLFSVVMGFAQEADKVLGVYKSEDGKGKVKITKAGDKYVGTLIWTSKQGAKDTKNPDEAKRGKSLVGLQILKGFHYGGKQVWEGGTVYDPASGKTYKCKMTLRDDGKLNIRGFVGMAAFGRTTTWTPVKE